MLAVAVDKKQIKKFAAIGIAVVVLAAAVAIVARSAGKEEPPAAEIRGETAAEREAYLAALGLEFSRSSTVSQVNVPEEWDERFESYNEMLKTCGFDLTALAGESVTKCTYSISNRTDLGARVFAVLLVKDGIVVGGHLITTDDNAFYPLTEPVAETSSGII